MKKRRSKCIVKRSKAGLGLFANAPFKKDEFVIEYTGRLITTQKADEKGGKYLFSVNSRWVVDGAGRKNRSRYINHSCRPNCEPWIEGRKIMIYAKKNIEAGDELTYNYGKEYFDEYIRPIGCLCAHCFKK